MFQKKYLIMIAIIICLLILYYFYGQISNLKNLLVPAHQKTMALEAKIIQLEKKTIELIPQVKKKSFNSKNESPPVTISYHSDMVRNNNNLSVKYSAISETEANELMKKLDSNKSNKKDIKSIPVEQEKQQQQNENKCIEQKHKVEKYVEELKPSQINVIPNGDFSDFKNENIVFTGDNNVFEDTETINFKINDLIDPNINKSVDNETADYEKILNGLEITNKDNGTENMFDDDEIDSDIIRSITDSIKYADMPSDNTLSEIPLTPNITTKKGLKKKINKNKRKEN